MSYKRIGQVGIFAVGIDSEIGEVVFSMNNDKVYVTTDILSHWVEIKPSQARLLSDYLKQAYDELMRGTTQNDSN